MFASLGIALHGPDDQAELIGNDIRIFQLMTHSTKTLGIIWTADMIADLRRKYDGAKLYAHSVFKVVIGRPFSSVIFREHYLYVCRQKFDGYIVHLPHDMDPKVCAEGVRKMLSSATRLLAESHVEPITVFLEHVPSKYYCEKLHEFVPILMRKRISLPLGLCVDTCHLFAAGISLDTAEKAKTYVDRIVATGLPVIFHLNDSAEAFGSFKDRHAELGNLIWRNNQSGLKYLLGLPNVKIMELANSASSVDFIIKNISYQ